MSQVSALSIAGVVEVTARANLRQGAPSTTAPVLRKLAVGSRLNVLAVLAGEAVQGNANWYGVEGNAFIWSGACGPLQPATSAAPASSAPAGGDPNDPAVAGFGLDPAFAGKLSQLLQRCRDRGLTFKVAQGLRTPQRQALYYCRWDQRTPAQVDAAVAGLRAKGAPWLADVLASCRDELRQPGWLTNAMPGEGWHQWGEAADCYLWRNGAMVEDGGDPGYATYADLAEQLGLTAGYRFKHRDSGHVQLRSAGGAAEVYAWSHIDDVMRERFGGKPAQGAGLTLAAPAAAEGVEGKMDDIWTGSAAAGQASVTARLEPDDQGVLTLFIDADPRIQLATGVNQVTAQINPVNPTDLLLVVLSAKAGGGAAFMTVSQAEGGGQKVLPCVRGVAVINGPEPFREVQLDGHCDFNAEAFFRPSVAFV